MITCASDVRWLQSVAASFAAVQDEIDHAAAQFYQRDTIGSRDDAVCREGVAVTLGTAHVRIKQHSVEVIIIVEIERIRTDNTKFNGIQRVSTYF